MGILGHAGVRAAPIQRPVLRGRTAGRAGDAGRVDGVRPRGVALDPGRDPRGRRPAHADAAAHVLHLPGALRLHRHPRGARRGGGPRPHAGRAGGGHRGGRGVPLDPGPAGSTRPRRRRPDPVMTWKGGAFGQRARCVLAPNPDVMTLDGTNTWVLREPDSERSVVVDPGPQIDAHLDAIAEAAGDVRLVLLTHGHLDHSEAARSFAERVGCPVRALDPRHRLGDEGLGHGDVVSVDGLEVRVVATPGHTADSLSFLLPAESAVLTGDTVLGRGTTVVAHPDGRLGAYLESLQRLHALAEANEARHVWPGHGPVIDDALAVLDFYLAHRRERLEQVREAVRVLGPEASPRQVVEHVYVDVDPVLWGAAELSVRAQ